MQEHVRSYDHSQDYDAVGRFLLRTYGAGTAHRNWLQPRWEYMHFHPALDADHLREFGVWEDENTGEIVGLVHYEHRMGINYVQLDPRATWLQQPMLLHAIHHLAGDFKIGRAVHVYIADTDARFQAIAASLGFEKLGKDFSEPTSIQSLEGPVALPYERIRVPDGFRLISLADDDDVRKVHRVMHRGFNHEGEPPEDELEDRRRKLSAPNFRRDLTIVAVAPDGQFASFAGIWYIPENRVAYIEPVATDPDHRRKGLGTAVVLEGLRRAAELGATVAHVGSDQPFYQSMGFRTAFRQSLWRKVLSSSHESGAS